MYEMDKKRLPRSCKSRRPVMRITKYKENGQKMNKTLKQKSKFERKEDSMLLENGLHLSTRCLVNNINLSLVTERIG